MNKEKHAPGMAEYIRALRLPFVTASVFPFIAGSLLVGANFSFMRFVLGLFAVVSTHLGANLINDYADSKSGVDWQDKTFYGFFGGSKLIQENVLSEKFYLYGAILCGVIAALSIGILAILFGSPEIIGYFLIIIVLGFSYSHKPLQLSYHRLGEFIIFILFGCAPVMGAYFIQTQQFSTLEGLCVSLPFGFFTTAILFANEVPDFSEDIKAGKRTWISIIGEERAYIGYAFIVFLGYTSIVLNFVSGFFGTISLVALIFAFLSMKATALLKQYPCDKTRLVEASKITIAVQALVSIVIIIGILT
ncbi:prenyltransferase [Candidatus Omnitrophota bacterium]